MSVLKAFVAMCLVACAGCGATDAEVVRAFSARCAAEGLEVTHRAEAPAEVTLLQVSRGVLVETGGSVPRAETRALPLSEPRTVTIPVGETRRLGPPLEDAAAAHATRLRAHAVSARQAIKAAEEGRGGFLADELHALVEQDARPTPTNAFRFLLRLGPHRDSPKAVGRCRLGEAASLEVSR